MSNIDPKEICENCVHFADENDRTECRKYAPRKVVNSDRPWANVQKVEWCSQFEGKDEGPGQKGTDIMKRGVMSNR